MAPLARHCAKPALPVLDVPVLARLVRALAAGGVERVIVNTHAHPEQLCARRCATHRCRSTGSTSRRRAAAAAAFYGARELLGGDEPFLVVNGDMCLELDFAALVARHRRAERWPRWRCATIRASVDFGSIGYDRDGHVCRITDRIDLGSEKASGLFIGVQVMSPAIFARMPSRERLRDHPGGVRSGAARRRAASRPGSSPTAPPGGRSARRASCSTRTSRRSRAR